VPVGKLRFRITTSGGVRRKGASLILAEYDGVEIGVHFRRWQRFEDYITRNADDIEVDLAGIRASLTPDADEINLDPETIYIDGTANARRHYRSGDGAREAAESTYEDETFSYSYWSDSGTLQVLRAVCRFDTSAYPYVSQAVLYLTMQLGGGDPTNCYVSRASFAAPLSTASNFGACKTAYETNPVGLLSRVSGDLYSIDLTAVYAATNTFDLALVHNLDKTDGSPPDWNNSVRFYAPDSGNDEPYMELTVSPGRYGRFRAGRFETGRFSRGRF